MNNNGGTNMRHRVRFTQLVSLLFILSIISGCVTQRRCLVKFPPTTTIDTVETVLIIDTTIYIQLPADTVLDSILVPVIQEPAYVSDVATARGEYASARAWIANNILHVQLVTNDTLIAWRIDSLALVNQKTITIEKEHIVTVKKTPLFFKVVAGIAAFLFVLVLFMLYLSLRRR